MSCLPIFKNVHSVRSVRWGGDFFFKCLSIFSYVSIKYLYCLFNKQVFNDAHSSQGLSSGLLCLSFLLRVLKPKVTSLFVWLCRLKSGQKKKKSVFWRFPKCWHAISQIPQALGTPSLKPLKIWGRGTVLTLQHALFLKKWSWIIHKPNRISRTKWKII